MKSVMISLLLALMIVGLPLPIAAQDQGQEDLAAQVLNYIADNPDHVGVACFPIADPEAGLYHNADESFPLASTFKILVLAAWALEVSEGTLDPAEHVPLADLDVYYLPGTDGGAQELWLAEVESQGLIEDETIALEQVVYGVVRYSTNAGTDYLIDRLSEESFQAVYDAFGLDDQDKPQDILGLFLAQRNPDSGLADPETLTEEEIIAIGDETAALYLTDADWRAGMIDSLDDEQSIPEVLTQFDYFNQFGNQGTPREFAQIMAGIYTGEALGEDASALLRDLLDWPMDIEGNDTLFTTLGTKGGSLPGVLTSAYFAEPIEGEPIALAVFYRELDPQIYIEWLSTFAQQILEFAVLTGGCEVLAEALPGGE